MFAEKENGKFKRKSKHVYAIKKKENLDRIHAALYADTYKKGIAIFRCTKLSLPSHISPRTVFCFLLRFLIISARCFGCWQSAICQLARPHNALLERKPQLIAPSPPAPQVLHPVFLRFEDEGG